VNVFHKELICSAYIIFMYYVLPHLVSGLTKFIEQAKQFQDATQYDLIAAYLRSSSDCSDILQLLESLGTCYATKSKPNSNNSGTDQDVANKVCDISML
jgi:hypothetical protein